MKQYRAFVRLPWDNVALAQVVEADGMPEVFRQLTMYFGSVLSEYEFKVVCVRRCNKKVTINIDDINLN